MYLPSDPVLEWPGDGPLFQEMQGPKCGHYSSHPLGRYYVRPRALGQVRYWCKSLSYVVEYLYQIC